MAHSQEPGTTGTHTDPAARGMDAGEARLRLVGWIVAALVLGGGAIAFLLAQVPGRSFHLEESPEKRIPR